MPHIELRAGNLELVLSPEVGGSIARFDFRNGGQAIPIFRPAPAHSRNVLEAGCFPVVPFANRVRGGAFHFRGRTVTLRPNMAGEQLPLHGQGWLANWQLGSATAASADLLFEHKAGEWPWTYEARQQISIDPGALEITLSCRNLSEDDMPCGLGHHPYFPCSPTTVLHAETGGVWTIDSEILPVAKVKPDGRYDLRHAQICGRGLDNGYDGWTGRADLTWPEHALSAAILAPTPLLQIYAPAQGGLVVIEPVTNANAALNAPENEWASCGLRILKQYEECSLTVRFELRAPR